jgi:hypothetical protein
MKRPGILLFMCLFGFATKGMAEDSLQTTVPELLPPETANAPAVSRSRSATFAIEAQPQEAVGGQAGASIGLNFTGSTLFVDSGFIPPDTMGAVGPEHITELINGRYSVYRKSDGLRVQTSSLDQFWLNAGVSFNGFSFDPRILYDPFTQRWFASSADNSNSDNHFLLAVSKSADPTAGWTGFAIDSDSANLRWADFPTLGITAQGIVLSANMFPIADRGAVGIANTIVVLPKGDLIGDNPSIANRTLFESNSISVLTGTGFSAQPVFDLDGSPASEVLLSSPISTFSTNFLTRSEIGGSITAPALNTSTALISVAPFLSQGSADQPGPKQNVEIANGSIFHANIVRQNGSLWGVHTVSNQGHAALQWFQIDAATNQLLQEGLIADPDLDFYYGSIAVNKFGDVAIGFNGSGESQFISSYAAMGTTVAGITTFGAPLQLKSGAATYFQDFGTGRNRWGDYSATVIDPSDPFAFWTFQEFVSTEDHWSTQITQFVVGQPAKLNDLVSFVPDPATFTSNSDTSGCPIDTAGEFTFTARLANQSDNSLSHLLIKTKDLTNNNVLRNADYGPAGVGPNLTVPRTGDFSDGTLSPGESVDVPFAICLSAFEPFSFYVDVVGIQEGDIPNSVVSR